MGLNKFSLEEEGAGEVRSLAKWSAAHYERTGKPLRIAVDEGNWWFRSVTEEEDARIKILDRLSILLRLNIQIVFVFDGPNKPKKLDRKTPGAVKRTSYSNERIHILRELLRQLGVPYYDAPGEAEAQCARLQQLNIVDAVWTDDSDALLFGATTVVQFYKAPGKKSNSDSEVMTYTAERLNLSRNSLLMWAILVGCDHTDGLDRFAKESFKSMQKHDKFAVMADELKKVAEASDEEFSRESSKWRAMLTQIDQALGLIVTNSSNHSMHTPWKTEFHGKNFPDKQTLKACAYPNVSPDNEINHWSSRQRWSQSYGPDMQARYTFFFCNFYSRKHEIWVAQALVPIELTALLRAVREDPNKRLADNIVRSMVMKERKGETVIITVNPLAVIPEVQPRFPQDLMRRNGQRILAPPLNPMDVEILDCVLRHGLPGDVYHKMVEHARKKSEAEEERKMKAKDKKTLLKGVNECLTPKRGRGRPRKDAGQNDTPTTSDRKRSADTRDELEQRERSRRRKELAQTQKLGDPMNGGRAMSRGSENQAQKRGVGVGPKEVAQKDKTSVGRASDYVPSRFKIPEDLPEWDN
ncbi:hypothetical protein GGR57DRAFT_503524 [Xylariaceae sp. FL1272]|nr:hypothetical protein GGR57DRAFT_503524 [Xylariaceae sp. FL1272]